MACGGSAGANFAAFRSRPTEWTIPGGSRGGAAAFSSWTGRAVSARHAHGSHASATILVVGSGCWAAAGRAMTGQRFKVLICAQPPGPGADKPINTGILTVLAREQTVAELQEMVEFDSGVLLTVDVYRRDLRARGELIGRFELPPLSIAASLLLVGHLLGSPGLHPDDRRRLQRRFTAICDAMKARGADEARIAWRLGRLVADVARKCPPDQDVGRGGRRRI